MNEQEQQSQDHADQSVVTVEHDPAESRFGVWVDGTLAGFSQYKDVHLSGADQRIFFHTEVFDEYGGRGLAGTLTRAALTASSKEGLRLVPVCPYVKRWVSSHHDVDEALDPVRPEHLEAVR